MGSSASGPADVFDTTIGQMLRKELVKTARLLEMDWLKAKNVWTKCAIKEWYGATGKGPISIKLVDTNKGDDLDPNYRSRFVARDIRRKGEDSIVAPTPPLEALRTISSLVATEELWPETV